MTASPRGSAAWALVRVLASFVIPTAIWVNRATQRVMARTRTLARGTIVVMIAPIRRVAPEIGATFA
jgi:hypothetical protein